MKIKDLKVRKILNSNGNWTIECKLFTDNDKVAASVPAGISLGEEEREPVGVDQAIKEIENEILPQVKNKNFDQQGLDDFLSNHNWGSNSTLAVSASFFKLDNQEAIFDHQPKLMMLIFEGKEHGNRNLRIQEYMIIVNNLNQGVSAYHQVRKLLKSKDIITTVGVEGGFSPPNFTDNQILEIISDLKFPIALDVAANTNPLEITELIDFVQRFPIISLEDPISENNRNDWKILFDQTREVRPEILIIGDDLTVTDYQKIQTATEEGLINGVIIKPNQQGTISAAAQAVKIANELGLKTVTSHRGETTNDNWIVDFALKYKTDFVKFGAPCRGERVAKYNRLI